MTQRLAHPLVLGPAAPARALAIPRALPSSAAQRRNGSQHTHSSSRLDPNWTLRPLRRRRSRRAKPPRLRRFREVGATGFEPATFRPPSRTASGARRGERNWTALRGDHVPTRRAADLAPSPALVAALEQLAFSQRRSNAAAAPQPGFVELPECLPCVLLALSTASQELVRLIEFRTQLRDGSTQEFELGALFVAQFDAPIPSLIGLSHRPIFAVRVHRPARRAPACQYVFR